MSERKRGPYQQYLRGDSNKIPRQTLWSRNRVSCFVYFKYYFLYEFVEFRLTSFLNMDHTLLILPKDVDFKNKKTRNKILSALNMQYKSK